MDLGHGICPNHDKFPSFLSFLSLVLSLLFLLFYTKVVHLAATVLIDSYLAY